MIWAERSSPSTSLGSKFHDQDNDDDKDNRSDYRPNDYFFLKRKKYQGKSHSKLHLASLNFGHNLGFWICWKHIRLPEIKYTEHSTETVDSAFISLLSPKEVRKSCYLTSRVVWNIKEIWGNFINTDWPKGLSNLKINWIVLFD